MAPSRQYTYVGPPEIRAAVASSPSGVVIATRADLTAWISSHIHELAGDGFGVTFTVTVDGALRIAPRRSEHIACAAGGDVLAAGELVLGVDARVVEASNQSTGFCPEPECWTALVSALDTAAILRPAALTHAFVFRRCESCGERNVVKDDNFVCAICDADLPPAWNFE